MNIYVIRHGETNMGKNKIIATENEPLNSKGIQQAIDVGKEIKKLNIDKIYCSPIERAKDTLRYCELDKDTPVIIDERLKERNMGIYEKIKFEDLDWKQFWGYNSHNKYSELEAMKDVYFRVSNFLEELKMKETNQNILLVTHGGVSIAIYWYFNGIDNSLAACENCKIYQYTL